MKNYFKLSSLLVVLTALIWAGCAPMPTGSAPKSFAGDYETLVKNVPDGDLTGVFSIKQDGKIYSALLNSDYGSKDIEDFKIEGNIVTGYFYLESYKVNIKGEIMGDNIKGKFSAEGYSFPWTAMKKQ